MLDIFIPIVAPQTIFRADRTENRQGQRKKDQEEEDSKLRA